MNIGILCHSSFGGSARIATELAFELVQQQHAVHVFSRTIPFGSWDLSNNVNLHCLDSEGHSIEPHANLYINWNEHDFQGLVNLILDVIEAEGLDVLHFHYAVPFAYVASEIKRLLGDASPLLVGTLHGTDVSLHSQHSYNGVELRESLSQADCLTTVSHSHADLATKNLNLPQSPLVIYNFVDLVRFRPDLESTSENVKPVIVHASNFRPVKQTPLMARLFSEILSRHEAELWLIGDGPDMPEVRQILAQNDILQHVRFWGLQPNISFILEQADVLLMTSKLESFCLVALEAMACGLPVLSTKVGGVPEVVLHGETGILFESNNLEEMADDAVRLLSDPARLERMSEAALQRARRFHRTQIVASYVALYYKMLSVVARVD